MSKHRGGSLLPSEGRDTFDPVQCGEHTLRVVGCDQFDTYFLTVEHGSPRMVSLLAEHPNGHSMRELALRMEKAVRLGVTHLERVSGQHEFIAKCGGMVRPWQTFLCFMGKPT